MKYNGQEIKVGSIVDVNGEKRIVTRIERDTFCSDEYKGKAVKADAEPKIEDAINPPEGDAEEVVVTKTRGRGKK